MRLAREPLAWHPSTTPSPESPARRCRPGAPPAAAQAHLDDMANRESTVIEITPEVLLKAYACGIFPMAESAEDPALYWIEPEMRGIIPLDGFHLPARLARTVRSDRFTVTVNRDFDARARRLRLAAAGPAAHLDQRAHPHALPQAARAPALPQPRSLRRRRTGRRALRRHARPRVLRREHVSPRARCLEGRAGASDGAAQGRRLQAVRHAVRHRAPQELRRDRSAEAAISQAAGSGADRRSRFHRARTERPVTGAEALALLADTTAHQQP